jgi:hypothetical protein
MVASLLLPEWIAWRNGKVAAENAVQNDHLFHALAQATSCLVEATDI